MIQDDNLRGPGGGGTPGYSIINQGPHMTGAFDRSSLTAMGGTQHDRQGYLSGDESMVSRNIGGGAISGNL